MVLNYEFLSKSFTFYCVRHPPRVGPENVLETNLMSPKLRRIGLRTKYACLVFPGIIFRD
jgi:hypothetical protein